jgi:hypothetical protein
MYVRFYVVDSSLQMTPHKVRCRQIRQSWQPLDLIKSWKDAFTKLTAAMFPSMHAICFGPFCFIGTFDPVSCFCFTPNKWFFFCEGSWPLCSLPNFVRKLCHVCATDSGFHITFHSKSAFFHHTPLCHDSAQCNAMNAHDKLMLIPVLPTHSSTNYKASKYVSLPHHILYKKSNLMESCSCADLCYSITKE